MGSWNVRDEQYSYGVSMADQDLLIQVEHQAKEMAKTEQLCERGYAHLGWLLLHVAEMQYWRVHYSTFRDYLKSVALVAHKTPEQLQRYFLTVRDLSDTFRPDQLEAMGITKAMQLRQAKDYALVLPSALITAALDSKVTAKDLRKLISITLKMPEEDGDWMDLECEFMVSPEQRELLEQAIDVARHTEPMTKSTISKSQQMLDVMQKFAMEFMGAHSGDGQ
jgi:hypothetical protein